MAKPQALVYRGNTGNAGYGFEQVLDGPDQRFAQNNQNDDDDNEPNQYTFAVAGNRKAMRRPGPI